MKPYEKNLVTNLYTPKPPVLPKLPLIRSPKSHPYDAAGKPRAERLTLTLL
jgi:hypothetical protein